MCRAIRKSAEAFLERKKSPFLYLKIIADHEPIAIHATVHSICIKLSKSARLPCISARDLDPHSDSMLDPEPETNADTKIRYKDDFHLIGAFSVQTVAEAELTPDVENSSLEQVSQLPTVLCVLMIKGLLICS